MLDNETTPASPALPETTPESMWCRHLRKDGGQCRGWPDKSGFCPAHRPGARENQSAGGKASSKQQRLERKLPSRLKPVLELLEKAIQETYRGELQPQRATAMSALAGSLIRLLESAEFELRLARLEEMYASSRKGVNNTWPIWKRDSGN